jgi:septal ring factor EnvC (AmiA/AmiB activator)
MTVRSLPKILLFCGILCIFFGLLPVYAAPKNANIDTLRIQQQQVKQQRQNVVSLRDRLTSIKQEAQHRLTGLEQNLQTTDSHIADSELQLKVATERLQELQADLGIAEQNYQNRQTATIGRLRFLQRSPASVG